MTKPQPDLTWEWLDLGANSRIYPFGQMDERGGFIIGGLNPSQAKVLVTRHNEAIAKVEAISATGQPDPNAEINYKWALADMSALLEIEKAIIGVILDIRAIGKCYPDVPNGLDSVDRALQDVIDGELARIKTVPQNAIDNYEGAIES